MPRSARRHPALSELGNRVRRSRLERGLSQMALAEAIDLHFSFVSEVERGIRNISMSSLLRLAEGLSVDPGTLVQGLTWSPSNQANQKMGRPRTRQGSNPRR